MWDANGKNIEMVQGEYGITLPIKLSGITITAQDSFRLSIKDGAGGPTIIEKTFSSVSDSTINLELTQAESGKLQPRSYVYDLDWYQAGTFEGNLVNGARFKVVGKA